MRILVTSVIFIGTTWVAQAQLAEVLPASPVTGTEVSNYCVFENKIYSPGALICNVTLKPSYPPQECQPADAAHKRAYWKILDAKTVTCSQ